MKRVVLVGGGHAHLELVRQASKIPAKVILVAPRAFYYSGMAAGVVGGSFALDEARIDLATLAGHHGVEYHDDRVRSMDPEHSVVSLASGRALAFDVVSFNIGSRSRPIEHTLAIKPFEQLLVLRDRLARAQGPIKIAILGGGWSGCELAGNCKAAGAEVILIEAGSKLLGNAPTRAQRLAERQLRGAGVMVHVDATAEIQSPGELILHGTRMCVDMIVNATGLRAPGETENLEVGLSQTGEILTGPTLASRSTNRVFAVGDCACFGPMPLPKLGVFPVRAAESLLQNIVLRLENRPLRSHQPQSRWLSILNLGPGRAVAVYGSWVIGAGWVWYWKRWLDLHFVRRYHSTAA